MILLNNINITFDYEKIDLGNSFLDDKNIKQIIVPKTKSIDAETLGENLNNFISSISSALDCCSENNSYEIDEISLNVSIGVEGQISLLSLGSNISSQTGLTITLKRKDKEK